LLLLATISICQAQELGFKRVSGLGINFIAKQPSLVYTKEYVLGEIPLTIGGRVMGYYGSTLQYISLFVGPTANYHFIKHDKIDLYAGGTLGINLETEIKGKGDFTNRFQSFLQVGTHYFFSDRIGAYVQGNLDLKNLNQSGTTLELGISFRRK
jgi:hypothetical protein